MSKLRRLIRRAPRATAPEPLQTAPTPKRDPISGAVVTVKRRGDSPYGLEVSDGPHQGRWLSVCRECEVSDETREKLLSGVLVKARVQKNSELFMGVREFLD